MQNNNSMMDEVTPIKFFLSQNYPNPFSEKTVIKYCVAYKTRVQIAVYNTEGEEIEKLVDEEKNPGTYEVEFSASLCHSREGKNLDQGYYYYRMTAGDFTSEKKWLCINKLSGRINMKNLIQFLFFFLLVTQICFTQPVSPSASQGGWEWQNPLPQGNNLNDVFFFDANTGWAVGDAGTIIKTTDGGSHWNIQASRISNAISSVYFVDANKGWAVCGGDENLFNSDAIILKTTNGGTDWIIQSIEATGSLNSVCFINEYTGWAVGGTIDSSNNFNERILKTTDGGQNWISQTTGLLAGWKSVCFIDANNGWILGSVIFDNEKIVRTTDGGNNWSTQASGTTFDLRDIHFTDVSTGWVVGVSGTILHTTNGGSNWNYKNNGVFNSVLMKIRFLDTNIGWVVGNRWNGTITEGILFKTTNGGDSWLSQIFETTGGLSSVNFIDNTGWVVGEVGTTLKSTDGGNIWISQTSGERTGLKDVEFVNANKGWTVGENGRIFSTFDAGSTWISQQSGTDFLLNSISFIDENNGWIVGSNSEWYDADSSVLLYTSNGGINWSIHLDDISGWLGDVCFIDNYTGFIVGGYSDISGSHPTLLYTSNGGTEWNQLNCDSLDGSYLLRVCFVDENSGWIIANQSPLAYGHDVVIKTSDGGLNWAIKYDAGWMRPLNGIHFINSNIGIVVGGYNRIPGFIATTTDGGQTWVEKEISFGTPRNVQLVGLNEGIVVTDHGRIIKTTDTGGSWVEQARCTSRLKSVYFVSELIGWAVGDNGTILHTTNGGVSFVEEEQIDGIPTEFLLSQNFPNPFNPSTRIKYQVSSISFVSLVVYDILGCEIETLVNEEKPAGTYELNWNAEALPSGVYFYQLKAGEFIQTKKMLLLK